MQLLLGLSSARLHQCGLFFGLAERALAPCLRHQVQTNALQIRVTVFLGVDSRMFVQLPTALGYFYVLLYCSNWRSAEGRVHLIVLLVFVLVIVFFSFATGGHIIPVCPSAYSICEGCWVSILSYRLYSVWCWLIRFAGERSSFFALETSFICWCILCTALARGATTAQRISTYLMGVSLLLVQCCALVFQGVSKKLCFSRCR